MRSRLGRIRARKAAAASQYSGSGLAARVLCPFVGPVCLLAAAALPLVWRWAFVAPAVPYWGTTSPFRTALDWLPQLRKTASPRPGPGALACAAFPLGPGCLLLWARSSSSPLGRAVFRWCPSGGRSFLVAAGRCPCRLLSRLSVLASGRYGRGVFGALPPRGQGFPLLDVGIESPYGAAHPRPGHPRCCLSPAAEREWLSSGATAEPARGMIWRGMHSVPCPPVAVVECKPPLAKPI